MTIIPEKEASRLVPGDGLVPGDVYEVGRGGPLLVVWMGAKHKMSKMSFRRTEDTVPGIMAIPLRHSRANRITGSPCRVVVGNDDLSPKKRADVVGFESSGRFSLESVSPGEVFSLPLVGSEVLVVRDTHGCVFLMDGRELDAKVLDGISTVETFDVVTDITTIPEDGP